jgi:4'-phosphopantetheinyl transferase
VQLQQAEVWMVRLNAPEGRQPELLRMLDVDERRRAERFRLAPVAAEFIQAHVALRLLLARQTGQRPAELEFKADAQGKPFLPGETRLSFNLSHTQGYAAIILATGDPVGIDIEKLHTLSDLVALLDRVCTPGEREELLRIPQEKREEFFFQLWTRKEALLKALGSGLRMDPRRVEVGFAEERELDLSEACARLRVWHVLSLTAESGYAAAAAYGGVRGEIEMRPTLDLLDLIEAG